MYMRKNINELRNPVFSIQFTNKFQKENSKKKRRARDSNPRNHISSSTDFESAPFDHSGSSPIRQQI